MCFELYQFFYVFLAKPYILGSYFGFFDFKGMFPIMKIMIVKIFIKKMLILEIGHIFLWICASLHITLFRVYVVFIVVNLLFSKPYHAARLSYSKSAFKVLHELCIKWRLLSVSLVLIRTSVLCEYCTLRQKGSSLAEWIIILKIIIIGIQSTKDHL